LEQALRRVVLTRGGLLPSPDCRNSGDVARALPQNEVKIGGEKCAVTVLLDYVFAWSRSEIGENLHAQCSVDERGPISDWEYRSS
jgi:hypothetical protein